MAAAAGLAGQIHGLDNAGLNNVFRFSINDNSRDEELGIVWTDADESMVKARVDTAYLPKFWKMMVHIYKRSPSDLFMWGLRIGDNEDEILRDLCEILPHEVWQSNLSLLRYCLQRAICLRVKNHAQPFGFFKGMFLGPMRGLEQCLSNVEAHERDAALADGVFNAWVATAQDMETSVGAFMWELSNIIRGTEVIGTLNEERFFILQKIDILNIRRALDALHGKGLYPLRVDMRYVTYIRSYAGQWPTFEPFTKDMLNICEKVSILNRRRARAMGLPDIPVARHEIYTRIPYWLSSKCEDKRVKEVMFQYGDLWTVYSTAPIPEQPVHEEAVDNMDMENSDDH
ncbi:hypothetical protein GL218_04197 [Daldinia childiae]|uniref:uncharacterized protein n=1 Tax=Daldinia childiae TaxID=326645 RepID=UPI001446440D|nr:uncharacterized protein GL218_04197 [Daldinia childiae]KAF3061622.1 hypothetical protein GL218_04197 [Daldinia childiae]